jgi:prepilin signal peptidase PulO-like enzyme (type II secretory pathway)
MLADIFIGLFIFTFGLCIGSFLNCFIYRLEQKKKITGRSFCPNCKHTLNWQDLIPVLSFLFLKEKCRYCRAKISPQYPIVELVTGMIFLLILNFKFEILNEFLIFQFLNLVFWLYIASALIIIFVYDLKHYIIPDKVLFPAILIAFAYRLFENLNIVSFIENWNLKIENFAPLGNYFLAAIIGSGFFLFIFLISKGRWMGFGDVKLAVLMGLLLGVKNVLVALFLAFFLGAVISIILIVLNRKKLKSEIPFGPFLIAGTFLAMFWGQQLILWYLNMFMIYA